MALREAGPRAQGATAYVTLEPCNHYGRTPPCSESLIAARVRRVVIATRDPNPTAAGGNERLRAAGIEVELGLLADEAADANRQFLTAIAHQRPYVVLKAAVTLDGRIATASGESQWITGPLAREQAHRLRAECGAVLVGRGTVEADNPALTARIPGVVNPPVRIVLDPNGRLSPTYQVFDDQAETLHITGKIDLRSLVKTWYERGIIGLLVEGGARTIAEFIRSGLGDELHLFVAPRIFGDGPSWVSAFGLDRLADAPSFQFVSAEPLAEDLWLRYRSETLPADDRQ